MIQQHANDGSDRFPRLEIFQATWAMMDLPGSRQRLDLPEAVDWIAANRFAGVMHWVQGEGDFAAVEVIRRAGLVACAGFPARDLATSEQIIRAAAGCGLAFLNAQVYDSFAPDEEAVAKLEALYELADRAGVPLFIETHRGMITQDLVRSVAYAARVPRAVFTLDASHYVVGGEIVAPDQSPRFNELLAEIVSRTACIHARVSNGEQVQVDVGDGSAPVAQPFIRWWTAAYRQWLDRAAPGDIFPFVSELGPRPYAIAAPTGEELGDRLNQALVFKHVAETIRDAVAAAPPHSQRIT